MKKLSWCLAMFGTVLFLNCMLIEVFSYDKAPSILKKMAIEKLSRVKVAVLYENITDGVAIGRSMDETIALLKDINAEFIFRGFWKWGPVLESPDSIPIDIIESSCGREYFRKKIAGKMSASGYFYRELAKSVSAVKKDIPAIIFCGAIPAQTLARVDFNPITGKVYKTDETWNMALDPQKWKIKRNGKPITKTQFQGWIYGVHPYGGKHINRYKYKKVPAYFPDITNPEFQSLLLSWAKKQIDCGADAIWIDGLLAQAWMLYAISNDLGNPGINASIDACSLIVDEIHKYGESKGKYIYVGSWSGVFVDEKFHPPALPLDFVTTSPLEEEIWAKKPDTIKWKGELKQIKKMYGDIPVLSFIDWAFDDSPMVTFSQKFSTVEQVNILQLFDAFCTDIGMNFVYPLHGGYTGLGKVTKKLSFGKFRIYDSLAPEFITYEIIKTLSGNKSVLGAKKR